MAELVVMTWNVQNLLPVGSVGGPTSVAEYNAKLAARAAVIAAVEPDVLAVQEIGDDDVVADLNDACGDRFPHRATGSPDGRGIRVALLSAHPLGDVRDVTTFPAGVLPVQVRDITFEPATSSVCSRGILSATVTVDGVDVTVITCHLKSKLISYARAGGEPATSTFTPRDEGERLRYAGYALNRRTADAMTCRGLLDEVLTAPGDDTGHGAGTGRDERVVFCGDLNDEPLAATSQIIQGPGGSEIEFRPNHHFIPQWFLRRFADGDERLVRVTLDAPNRPSPPTSVRNVAAIRDFYTVEHDAVGPTVYLENALADLDGEGVKPIERLASASPWFFPPSPVDRALVARFVALLAVRGPKGRRQVEALADLIAKASLSPAQLEVGVRKHLAAAGNHNPSPEEVAELTDLSDVEVDPGRGFPIQTLLESADRIVPVLMDRFLTVVKFSEPGGLVLPDSPVSLFAAPERASPFRGVGFGTADEIHVPLDRRTALALHRDESIGDAVIEASADQIDSFNQSTVWSAGSEVYCHPDDVHRLQRIELPDAVRPVAMANMGWVTARVDGVNAPPERPAPRRFRAVRRPS